MKQAVIVGATGAVGRELCAILRQRCFPIGSCRLLASRRSVGQTAAGVAGPTVVEPLTERAFEEVDWAFFAAGSAISREFVPQATKRGATVIDNSSAFRMEADVPLVIPEVNPEAVRGHRGIIANPNCSTIILAVVLWPLHRVNRIRRVVVSTYQAVSGAGRRALAELEAQTRAVLAGQTPRPEVFPVPCAFNVFSHDSPIDTGGYNAEETKLIVETRKIFADDRLEMAPTCLRVPVMRAHTEALSIEFTDSISAAQARELLASAPGLRMIDDWETNHFPTPLEATGRDEVLVGRIREDRSVPDQRGLQLICSGDQLRKGAALNAIQIAELLTGE